MVLKFLKPKVIYAKPGTVVMGSNFTIDHAATRVRVPFGSTFHVEGCIITGAGFIVEMEDAEGIVHEVRYGGI